MVREFHSLPFTLFLLVFGRPRAFLPLVPKWSLRFGDRLMWLLFAGTCGGTVACGLIWVLSPTQPSFPAVSSGHRAPGERQCCRLWGLNPWEASGRQPPAGRSSERCHRCASGMRGRGRCTPACGAWRTSHPLVAVSSLTCDWPWEDQQAPGTIFRSGAERDALQKRPSAALAEP